MLTLPPIDVESYVPVGVATLLCVTRVPLSSLVFTTPIGFHRFTAAAAAVAVRSWLHETFHKLMGTVLEGSTTFCCRRTVASASEQ